MKFICPSCKAKYQIADDKIAARTVRMKCRKCTEILEIGKQGAKLSVPPPAVAPKPAAKPAASAPRPAGSAPTPAPRRSAPLAPARPLGAARAGAPAPRPPGAATAEVSQKQPTAAALLLERARSEIRTRPSTPHAKSPLPAPSPSPAGPAAVPAASSAKRAKPEAKPGPKPKPEPRQSAPSALAGAFSAAVAQPTVEDHALEEWFVGINGVPVGPIRLSELRSKAASGAVNAESLVWRDGFEEWKALSTFPELLAIVEESRSSAHAIVSPFKPPMEHAAESAAQVTVPATRVAEVAPHSHPEVEVESQAELEALAGLRKRSGLSGPQLFAMIVAVAFGLTVGFVIFSGSVETREVVKYVEVPKEAPEKAAKPEETTPEETSDEEETEEDSAKAGKGTGTKGKVAKASPKEGLKGLSGLSGLAAGPQGPSGNSGTQARSGKPLDSAAVQSTVSRYTSSVKRSCWQPALDTRDNNAPTSARVSVTITVAASGNVQNVSTSGDPRGYRGLANCIASRVRGWQFPASSGQTTVNVPFVFAAQ